MDNVFDLCDCDICNKNAQRIPLIGDVAPEFVANTTNGKIKFPDDFAGKWVIFFSHPADFTPVVFAEEKIKKNNDGLMTIELKETQDVAKAVGERKQKGQVLIGFAAETEKLTEHASKKLTKKNLDMIVANDVTKPGAGFNVDTNIVTFITKDGIEDMPQMSKADVAEKLLDRAVKLYRK